MRAPSLRDPQAFFDVFVIILCAVVAIALVLSITNSPLIRLEMLLVFGGIVLWLVWAIDHILKRSRPY